jgi:hypothetical protein
MAQVFEDHGPGSKTTRVYASRNWNEVVKPADRADIDFRLQLRLIKDPKRKNVRPGESVPFSQYPADVSALRERRHRQGRVAVDGKFGNVADTRKHLEHPPRFLNTQTVNFQCSLRAQLTAPVEAWNSLPFRGGGTFEPETPRLDRETFPTDVVAFSAWRSQHKDVGVLFGNQRAKKVNDIRWTTSLRSPQPDHGANRTEGHLTEWLGKKKWYFSEAVAGSHSEDAAVDIKLNYIHNVRHIIP